MQESNLNLTQSKNIQRILFIDLARSIAIILMLEGHFITLTFEDYTSMVAELRSVGTSGSLIFDTWVKIRGFTAPLFFTITGVVFVFLLTKNFKEEQNTSFWKNKRVKKGLKRSGLLIFWGYFLQLNLKYFFYYLKGHFNPHVFSFHILQCIGFGIFLLILLFFIHKTLKVNLTLIYLIAGTLIFSTFPFLDALTLNDYFPKNTFEFIQNMFYGPNSGFPLSPWLGFVCFGGFLGSLIARWENKIQSLWFLFSAVALSILLVFYGRSVAYFLDILMQTNNKFFQKDAWVYDRLGEVVLLMSILMIITKIFKVKDSLFTKFGQNTLSIYIIHVIVLYGAIIGYSLKDILKDELNSMQAIIGAGLFISIFALYLKFDAIIHQSLNKVLQKFIRFISIMKYKRNAKD